VTIVEDSAKVVSSAEKLNMRYLDTLDHPVVQMLMEYARNGSQIIIKTSPTFFSAWDYAKMQ
jgi:hypothetical protein